jgi:flagellar basal body-associated protein FliL
MPADKRYNTFLFIPCEWSVGTQVNEKKKKTNVLGTVFLTGIVVIVVHILASVLSFFFLYTRVYNNVDEGSNSNSNSVGSQPTYVEKSFEKTHTHTRRAKKKERRKIERCML